ncbi:SusC/RagA family TonB-linked outer membrane protein [Flavitalea flava]
MNFLGIFLTVVCTQIYAMGLSQEKVSLECKDLTFKQTLTVIESRSSYRFLYHDSVLFSLPQISIHVHNKPVLAVIDQLIAGTSLHYRVLENNLVVFGEGNYPAKDSLIRGSVIDDSGQAIAGVTVRESGSKGGTVTNEKGEFSLRVKDVDGVIELSSVGYISQRVRVNKRLVLEVHLKGEDKSMQDVIVVGAQSQSRRTTTSAVSTISGKQIENLPAPSFDQLIQGRLSGINVQVNSGEPGTAPSLVVRGNTRVSKNIGTSSLDAARALSGPLYVIDGIPVNPEDITNSIDATGTNYLAGLNVNDIESISVQKDATATAAWGSRGANGVLYITTKKGRSSKPEFRVNWYSGVSIKPELLPTVTGQEERRQKLDLLNVYANGNAALLRQIPQMLTDSLNPAFNNATDWQGLFYRNAFVHNGDISMAAASDIVSYRLSMNYYNEEGIIKAFGYQRYSLRGNFDFKLSPKLNAQFIAGISRSDRQRGRKYTNRSLNGTQVTTNDENTPVSGANIPSSLYRLNSFDSLNFNGLYDKLRNQNINNQYTASLTLNYKIFKDLTFVSQASIDATASNKDYFQPSNIDAVAFQVQQTLQPSYAESDRGNFTNYFLSNRLNYSKAFNSGDNIKHHITLTTSQQFNRNIATFTQASGYNVPSNDIQVVSGVPQSSLGANSSYQASSLLSYVGQLQYDINQKYIAYVSERTDASSRFGTKSKWGNFGAAGLGWIVSDEKFMLHTSRWLSYLKLRASYGQSGNQSDDYYAPYNSYTLAGTYMGNPAIQPSYTNGLTKDNLTWTSTTQKDLGVDLNLFNNRVSIVADVYDKLSKSDYFNFNLPFFTGYQSVSFNATDLWVSNRGLDLTLITHNLAPRNPLQWTSTLTLSFNKNMIAKLPNGNRTFLQDDYYGVSRIYSVGQPIYKMFQMQYQGVYNNYSEIPVNPLTGQYITYFKGNHPVKPGDPIWKDQNKDYDVWSDEDNGDSHGDRVPTGNPNPLFTGGFVNDFSYKNFYMSVVCVFTWKRDIINTFREGQFDNIFDFPTNSTLYDFAAKRLPSLAGLNYWRPDRSVKDPNYKASFPALNPFVGHYYEYLPFSTMFNEDGSYFKIKNIVFGYKVPDNIVKRAKISGLRFYGVMDNVLILKKTTVPDPEAVDNLGVYTGGQFPVPRKFTLGLEIQF